MTKNRPYVWRFVRDAKSKRTGRWWKIHRIDMSRSPTVSYTENLATWYVKTSGVETAQNLTGTTATNFHVWMETGREQGPRVGE